MSPKINAVHPISVPASSSFEAAAPKKVDEDVLETTRASGRNKKNRNAANSCQNGYQGEQQYSSGGKAATGKAAYDKGYDQGATQQQGAIEPPTKGGFPAKGNYPAQGAQGGYPAQGDQGQVPAPGAVWATTTVE